MGYRIAPQDVEAHDGVVYEGTGIPPASFVRNTMEDVAAGKDVVLEKVIELMQ